ncbi:MAG: hypothetical protein HQL09_06910 [Nitrospirae bacterium]|nr:hypothetical protein [Nitrospirota bacterium]
MASGRSIGNIRSYCDVIFDELTDMKSRVLGLVRDIELMQGHDKELVISHVRHLNDIANTIDWKLEILTKVCPTDWMRYAAGAESVSVKVPGKAEFDKDFTSAGDFGG